MDLSFSGAGFMGCYYFGVVNCWKKYIPRERVNRVAGASAGSLIAAYYLLDLPLDDALAKIISMTEEIRSRALGVFDRSHQIVDVLPRLLDSLFPADAHLRVSGKLFVCMTRLRDMKKVVVSEFETRQELIEALNCSCFIPVWSGNHVSTWRGVKHIDGGFSDNLPVFDEHTIRVCCFAGRSDISPYDRATFESLSVTVLNTPLYCSWANLRRGRHALSPPAASYIVGLLERGFHDTKAFILANDLIQCDACWHRAKPAEWAAVAGSPTISPAVSRSNSVSRMVVPADQLRALQEVQQNNNNNRDDTYNSDDDDRQMERSLCEETPEDALARQRDGLSEAESANLLSSRAHSFLEAAHTDPRKCSFRRRLHDKLVEAAATTTTTATPPATTTTTTTTTTPQPAAPADRCTPTIVIQLEDEDEEVSRATAGRGLPEGGVDSGAELDSSRTSSVSPDDAKRDNDNDNDNNNNSENNQQQQETKSKLRRGKTLPAITFAPTTQPPASCTTTCSSVAEDDEAIGRDQSSEDSTCSTPPAQPRPPQDHERMRRARASICAANERILASRRNTCAFLPAAAATGEADNAEAPPAGSKGLLVRPDRFTASPSPLPSCPPSPVMGRRCLKCSAMRQTARIDSIDEQIRQQADKYRQAKLAAKSESESSPESTTCRGEEDEQPPTWSPAKDAEANELATEREGKKRSLASRLSRLSPLRLFRRLGSRSYSLVDLAAA